MLQITIPSVELFDEVNSIFINTKEQTLQLEHSLVSLSKWESKWCKPFMSSRDKTVEETLDYIRCMTITQNVNPEVYLRLSKENVEQIERYIEAPMTATTVPKQQSGKINNEIVTSELIYYWMFSLNIPKECEKWHLNRLITLIQACNFKNQPPSKRKQNMSDIITQQAALNAKRRAELNSKG